MLLKWLNLYLGNACNSNCKYCFRKYNEKPLNTPKLTSEFKQYLINNAIKYKRILMFGGETLLYFNIVKEICNIVPKYIPKRIMTNGKLLNKDIIEFCNNNNIQVCISYDGVTTLQNRGYDILDEKLDLIHLINDLCICSVISGVNLNIENNYQYIKNKLNRDFQYMINIYLDNNIKGDKFLKEFDYKLLRKYLVEFTTNHKELYKKIKIYNNCDDIMGTMTLLNGDIVCLTTFRKYGTVFDNENVVFNNIINDWGKCKDCNLFNLCTGKKQLASKHFCKIQRLLVECSDYEKRKLL